MIAVLPEKLDYISCTGTVCFLNYMSSKSNQSINSLQSSVVVFSASQGQVLDYSVKDSVPACPGQISEVKFRYQCQPRSLKLYRDLP